MISADISNVISEQFCPEPVTPQSEQLNSDLSQLIRECRAWPSAPGTAAVPGTAAHDESRTEGQKNLGVGPV